MERETEPNEAARMTALRQSFIEGLTSNFASGISREAYGSFIEKVGETNIALASTLRTVLRENKNLSDFGIEPTQLAWTYQTLIEEGKLEV